MKLIEAIIRAVTIDDVKAALQKIGVGEIGIGEILVSRLGGDDQKNDGTLFYRGTRYASAFMTRMKVEIIVADDLVDKVIGTISRIAKTDGKGGCQIYVLPLIEAIH